MVIFTSESNYVESCATVQAKIAAIDALIDALYTTALKAVQKDHIREYWLNDGQTQIKTIYKGADQVLATIQVLEKQRQMYINRLTGRVTRLIDSKNLR